MKKRNGFTLIELLVVISIIALLMSILIPTLSLARESARQTYCVANMKQLALAYISYTTTSGDLIPNGFVSNRTSSNPLNESHRSSWVEAPQDDNGNKVHGNATLKHRQNGIKKGQLYKYAKEFKLYHCPSDYRFKKGATPQQQIYRTYVVPGALGGDLDGISRREKLYKNSYDKIITKFTRIKRPAEKYIFVEGASKGSDAQKNFEYGSWTIYPEKALSRGGWYHPIGAYHRRKASFSYADGHAESHKWIHNETVKYFAGNKPANELMPAARNRDLKWAYDHFPDGKKKFEFNTD